MAKSISLALPNPINDKYLSRIANIDELKDQYGKPYQFIRRSVKALGVFSHDKLSLKLYHMIRENADLPKNLADSLENFLISEINSGGIDPKQGIGFAILSQGFLSVNVWGRGNVLFTQTYTVEASPTNLSRTPLEKTGVACTWEIKIMNFEYELWHKYLMTPMAISDKKHYLTLFISGDLSEVVNLKF